MDVRVNPNWASNWVTREHGAWVNWHPKCVTDGGPENLEAVRRHPQAASRERITERLAVAETVRLQLKARLHEIAPEAMELAIQQDSDCFQENVIFESWLASFLRSLDQVIYCATYHMT